MFTVGKYKVTFKRKWHHYLTGGTHGRYNTHCAIFRCDDPEPAFTGRAKLHPNDQPDKIVGKKIALKNAMWFGARLEPNLCLRREVRTEIWQAFWAWVESWKNQTTKQAT
jgi:hypothetical protein